MAIEKRERKSSGRRKLYSYRVKWRLNGTGEQQARTLDNEAEANQLEDALRKSGWAYRDTDPEVKYLTLIGGHSFDPADLPTEKVAPPPVLTLREAVVRWANRPALERGTRRGYMQVADKRLGAFGDLPLDKVTLLDVENWLTSQKESYARSSVFVSQCAVTGALRANGFAATIAGLTKVTGERELSPIFLEEDQLAALVAFAEKRDGLDFSIWVEFTGELGPRWGEGAGLQVVHTQLANLDTAHVWIRQALKNDLRVQDGFRPEKVKSKNAVRMLPLTAHQAERLRLVVDDRPSTAIVFRPRPDQVTVCEDDAPRRQKKTGAPFWNARTFNYKWNRLTEACPDVPDELRWHDLRHTAAKNMLERGVPIAYVSKILGHSKVEVTDKEYGSFDQRSHDMVRRLMSA